MGNIFKKKQSYQDSVRDTREGEYTFGRLVVKEGESVSIFDSNGKQTTILGPAAFRPFFSQVKFLERVSCDQQSYLVVQFQSGKVVHIRGPESIFIDPCVHANISVKPAILLEANEAIVVYTEHTFVEGATQKEPTDESKKVTRRLVRGPNIFIPQSNEWLHEFSWHGTVIPGKAKGSITGSPNDTKTPHAVAFQKLRQLPDQMYYTVRDLRTSDDALLNLHIMIFFELLDIEQMMDTTNDPISDIINAANADVMTYGAQRTYEALLADSSGLSLNESYPLLATRMSMIGYKLNKVVYRGYQTSSQLQAMQESTISSRTKLRLEADTERQKQANTEFILKARETQAKLQFAQEEAEAKHRRRLVELEAEQNLQAERSRHAMELEHEQAMYNTRKEFLQYLSDLGVDLTQYLVAEVGSKPTSHLLIENKGKESSHIPQLHIH